MTEGARRAQPPRHGVAALAAVGVLGAFSAWWRIDRSDWKLDEDAYAQAGWVLVHQGIDPNLGHPPLAKLLFGVSQVVLGRNLTAVRTVSAIGVLVAMAVLFAFGRMVAGWWTGVAAAGLYAVLPRGMVVSGLHVADLRIDRYGMLEAVAAPLLVAGLWVGWRWIVRGGARAAAGAGALVGLAGAAKLNALAVLVPVAVVGAAFCWRRRHLGRDLALLVAAAVAGFVVPFLWFGRRAWAQLDQTLRFPAERAKGGHLLVLGHDVYDRSPWWANLRYTWDADGPILVAAVLVGLGLAVASRRRPAVAYLLAALATLVLTAMASPVALPHYRQIWVPVLVLLLAIGVVEPIEQLLARRSAGERSGLGVRTVAAGVVAAVLVVAGVVVVVRTATLGDGDYRTMAARAAADGVRPRRILVYGEAVAPYFPGAVDALAPFDDGSQPAQMVVLDPSLTDAVSPDTVATWRSWARAWGLQPHHVGRLEAWWAGP
ncbi:MAG: glycosyltransferase family 39 protein [Acidimicrobiales bacterium]